MNKKNEAIREKKWKEIESGKIKKPIFYSYAESAFLFGLLSHLPISYLNIFFAYLAIKSAQYSSKDKHENKKEKFVLGSRIGGIMGVIGLLRVVFSFLDTWGILTILKNFIN